MLKLRTRPDLLLQQFLKKIRFLERTYPQQASQRRSSLRTNVIGTSHCEPIHDSWRSNYVHDRDNKLCNFSLLLLRVDMSTSLTITHWATDWMGAVTVLAFLNNGVGTQQTKQTSFCESPFSRETIGSYTCFSCIGEHISENLVKRGGQHAQRHKKKKSIGSYSCFSRTGDQIDSVVGSRHIFGDFQNWAWSTHKKKEWS